MAVFTAKSDKGVSTFTARNKREAIERARTMSQRTKRTFRVSERAFGRDLLVGIVRAR